MEAAGGCFDPAKKVRIDELSHKRYQRQNLFIIWSKYRIQWWRRL
jgi:hypothetical protein